VFSDLSNVTWPQPASTRHEPLLLDLHMDRLSELVDRCLSLRKDIRDLEILAVRSAAEYELFIETSKIDEESEKRRLFGSARKLEMEGEQKALIEFGARNSIARGLKEEAKGRADALQEEANQISELEHLISARWDEVRRFQAAYRERFNEPGNAHNYGERAARLLAILQTQVMEAYERALAIGVGLETIYAWKAPPLPRLLSIATLDDLALWTLTIRKELDLHQEKELELEITVPLVQSWLADGK